MILLKEIQLRNTPEDDFIKPRTQSCTDREKLLKLGLWDVVYDEGIKLTKRQISDCSVRSDPGD